MGNDLERCGPVAPGEPYTGPARPCVAIAEHEAVQTSVMTRAYRVLSNDMQSLLPTNPITLSVLIDCHEVRIERVRIVFRGIASTLQPGARGQAMAAQRI